MLCIASSPCRGALGSPRRVSGFARVSPTRGDVASATERLYEGEPDNRRRTPWKRTLLSSGATAPARRSSSRRSASSIRSPKSTATPSTTPTQPWAARPSTSTATPSPSTSWISALRRTVSCWVPSAAPSGRVCPVSSGPKRVCSASARAWACTPTTAPRRFGPSWLRPAP